MQYLTCHVNVKLSLCCDKGKKSQSIEIIPSNVYTK